MKIIPPSFSVLDNLDTESLACRIEYCGRVCYKSEDLINHESAIPFVRKMAEHGHNSVLEMGVVSLKVECADQQPVNEFYRLQPKYFQTDLGAENSMLITGSVRAFREMYLFHPECSLASACAYHLAQKHPYFFDTITPEAGIQKDLNIKVEKVTLNEIDSLPPAQLGRHRYIAVKFIVNRAVTHEIVRHRPCSFLQESQRYCRYADNKFGGEITFIKPLFYAENSPEYTIWLEVMRNTEAMYLQLLKTSSPQAARTVLPNSCKTELIVYANLDEWGHIFQLRTTKAAEPSMREVMIPLQEEFASRFPTIFT